MKEFKKGDTVYFKENRIEVEDVRPGRVGARLHGIYVGILEEYVETEKEYFTRKLKEVEEEENKPAWPLPENTIHYYHYYSSNKIACASTGLVAGKDINQALSKERCIQLREKTLLIQDMYLWVDTFYPDWSPDWVDDDKCKYGIYSKLNDKLLVDSFRQNNFFCFGISVPTKEAAKEMLKVFEERLKEWY